MKIFDTKDGVLSGLAVDDTFGLALQVGTDIMITPNWGAFIDVKKAFLETKARGSLGGVPVRADVVVDPLVVHTGLTYRF